VEDLMACDLSGLQRGAPDPEMANQITQLGLDYRLVTQFTSFVAVEERTVTDHGQPKRVDVPVEMPDGVSYQGVFGDAPPSMSKFAVFSGATTFSGTKSFTGVVAGVLREQQSAIQALPPPAARLGKPQPVDHLESVKLEGTLARIAAKLRNGEMLAPGEQKLIHNGKIRIIVQVQNRSILNKLRDLGFREDQTRSRGLALAGEIPASQLSRLAQVEDVIFVSPTWPRP
jgi:Ca-activated chloride channel homolog